MNERPGRLRGALGRLAPGAFSSDGAAGGVHEVISSGFFVPAYYAAQSRKSFDTPADAFDDYLDRGAGLGLLPNPVHDFDRRPLPGRREVEAQGFAVSTAALPTRDHLDLASYVRLMPGASAHPGGPAGHFLQAVTTNGSPFGFTSPSGRPLSWAELLRLSTRRSAELVVLTDGGDLDQELYEVQTGLAFASREAAVWHYLERGEAAGRLPHVVFHPWAGRLSADHPEANRFSAAVSRGRVPQVADDVRAAVIEQARRNRAVELLAHPTMTATPEELRRWSNAEPPRTDHRRVTIVARASGFTKHSASNVATIMAQTHTRWDLVVGLDPEAPRNAHSRTARLAAHDDRIKVVDVTDEAGTADMLTSTATGDVVVVWDGQERWDPRFLELGLAALPVSSSGTSALVTCTAGHDTPLAQPDPNAHYDGPIESLEQLAWSGPRGMRGVIANRSVLRDRPDPLDGMVQAWVLLLSACAEALPTHVPVLGMTGPRHRVPPLAAVAAARAQWLRKPVEARATGTTTAIITAVTDTSAVAATARSAAAAGAHVVVGTTGRDQALELAAAVAGIPAVDIQSLPAPTSWGQSTSLAVAGARGDTCLFLNAGAAVDAHSLGRLLVALDTDTVAVSAVGISPDSTVASAGLVFPGRGHAPWRLLVGHPVEDVRGAVDPLFTAAESHGLLLRTATFDQTGLDPSLELPWAMIDLTLRATDGQPLIRTVADVQLVNDGAAPPLEPATTPLGVRHMLAAAPDPDTLGGLLPTGVVLGGWRSMDPEHMAISSVPVLVRQPRVVADGPARGLPALRWALKLPMQVGPRGDRWGDRYFADDLARSLERLGQQVVHDRRDSHHRPSSGHLDDVVLNLRGRIAYRPDPGATAILWIISHPELIDADEVDESVDLVYAASSIWAERASVDLGRTIRPLLQATDPRRFNLDVEPSPHGVLFVGRPRGGDRRVVRDAIAVGADLEVYGEGWDEVLGAQHVRDSFLSNAILPGAYRGARIVLNDHWPEMAAEGFWSNRTFDAAACGALIVSDDVAGGAEMFGGLVRTYSTIDELGVLLAHGAEGWPDPGARAALAEQIAGEHSFDRRAETMLADVLDLRGVDHELGRNGR